MAQDEREALEQLNSIRQSIDNIDAALIHLLAERFKFTQQVGRLKAVHGLPPSDPERERRQTQRLRSLAEGAHLDPAFAEKWFNFVVAEVIQHHEEIAGGAANGSASGSANGSANGSASGSATNAPAATPAHPVPHPGVHPVPHPSPSRPTP
jgi:chorismate mutase